MEIGVLCKEDMEQVWLAGDVVLVKLWSDRRAEAG